MTRAPHRRLLALVGWMLYLAAGVGLWLHWGGLGVWLLTGGALLALQWSRPEVEPAQNEPPSTHRW